MYAITWTWDGDVGKARASVTVVEWDEAEAIMELLRVLEIPYSCQYKPVPELLPGEDAS